MVGDGGALLRDTFLFYFSGHGITKGDKSFLLATNSDTTTPKTLELSAIPLGKANQILSGVQAQQLLTVTDTCRNDPDSGRGEKDDLLTNDFSRSFKIKRSSDHSSKPKVSAYSVCLQYWRKSLRVGGARAWGFQLLPVGRTKKGKMANGQG